MPTRKKLPHCQYGVYSPTKYENGFEDDCGEPATYLWDWGDSLGQMFVCDKHDEEICQREEE